MTTTDYMIDEILDSAPEPAKRPTLVEDMRIGSLVLLRPNGKDKNGKALWRCRCDACGKIRDDIRADNLKTGRTKSCGCQQHATTTGRRNQMSKVLAAAGVLQRFEIKGYFSQPVRKYGTRPGRKANSIMCRWAYAVVFVVDPARPDCCHGDRSKYYISFPTQFGSLPGNQNRLLASIMGTMAKLGWMGARPLGMSTLRWANIEGVTFETNKMPSEHDLRTQQAQQMKAAHIDFRGQTL